MLNLVASEKGSRFLYEQDFGDGSVHEVVVERIVDPEPGLTNPICLTGERACPHYDSGGPPGYEDILKALSDPKHPEHREFLCWFGDDSFNSEAFDLERANANPTRIS